MRKYKYPFMSVYYERRYEVALCVAFIIAGWVRECLQINKIPS